MGNTNEASKADLGKGVIGVRRGGSLIPTLHHVVPTPFPTVRGVPQFMGALYRFKSAKSIAKTAKFSLRFSLIFVNSTKCFLLYLKKRIFALINSMNRSRFSGSSPFNSAKLFTN